MQRVHNYPSIFFVFATLFTDHVIISIDSVLFLKIKDAYLASYGVEDPEYAISQLAQTTVRYEFFDFDLSTELEIEIRDNVNIFFFQNLDPNLLKCR